MPEPDDIELLRRYADANSEIAFTALVERHVNLVYSTALRSVGNAHAAEEIAQVVFIILAREAEGFSAKTILSGWLYQTTRLAAANFLRMEMRRQKREQEAFMQSISNEAEPEVWTQIAPLLDDAMARLGERERDAIVLRFFENKSAREMAAVLRIDSSAAQKRVTRALEKLRKFFTKRSVALSATAIAGAVSANSVHAAPVGLAKTISTVVIAKGATAGGSTLVLVKGALKLMAWTKAKTAIVAGAIVLLAAGTTITVEKIIAPAASFIRIEGKGQIELYDYYGKSRVVETGNLIVLTDGKSYRISIASESHSGLTNDVYDMNANYGCDGVDTFVLSDQLSYFHRTHDGLGGFAHPGRFPGEQFSAPAVADAAWLAYCSKDYFNVSSNQTGLKLFGEFSTVWPDFITNQVTYWTNSTLPQSITGWSRNWIIDVRTNSNQPKHVVELKQYPNGFKACKFTASDPVMVGNIRVPRQITLETFFPKPPNTATTGDDTELLRKATFIVDSVEIGKGRFNPLPPVTVPDLQIEDWRFKNVAGNFIIGSHATPQGWPVRGSKEFNQAAAEANKIASANHILIESELKKEAQIIPPP